MLSMQAEEMLEQMQNAQNRILGVLAVGFLSGFVMGLLAAWVLVRAATMR
jgi:hypothetical protein